MPDVRAGQRVAGHRLLERIGGGHFGDVWKADFEGRPVAVKVFRARGRASSFRREAFAQYALGRLSGPEAAFFPRVEAVELDHEPPYLRMELIDGRPLEDALLNPALVLERRLALGRAILEALAAVHRHGFVHGDLSPRNVLVAPDGTVRLIDVGFGALFDEGVRDIEVSGTAEEQSMGVAAPLYAAPERFGSEFLRGCGKPADVFSFGKILYALLTGQPPFVIKPVSRALPALGAAWDDFLFRCLEESPDRRFPDAAAALAEFDRLHRPEPSPGEFRAECPECGARASIPGGWAGERFACPGCRLTLEVLFYDEAGRHASTAVVADAQEAARPEVEFLDDPRPPASDGRARKFCPSCGRSIWTEARKCRHCGVWVDETAQALVAARGDARRREREDAVLRRRSFVGAAAVTFLAYFVFWIPGALLNWEYLREAEQVRRVTGEPPSGHGLLKGMMVLFAWLPLGIVAGLFGTALLFASIGSL